MALALGMLLLPPGIAAVEINELRIDEPGPDRREYFELRGIAGASLDGLSYIVIGDDDDGGCGSIEEWVSLDGIKLDSNGFCVVGEWDEGIVGQVLRELNFENNDAVTHLIVRGFRGARGMDVDENDDGKLDRRPWDEILDAVSFSETAQPNCVGHEYVYSSTIVPTDGSFVAGHAYRCDGVWRVGGFAWGSADTAGRSNDCHDDLAREPAEHRDSIFLK